MPKGKKSVSVWGRVHLDPSRVKVALLKLAEHIGADDSTLDNFETFYAETKNTRKGKTLDFTPENVEAIRRFILDPSDSIAAENHFGVKSQASLNAIARAYTASLIK